MGQVFFPGREASDFFFSVMSNSRRFDEMTGEVLKGGDYQYLLTDQDVSFCDSERRTISIGVKSGGGDPHLQNSDIILEWCNAYVEATLGKPKVSDFADPMVYAAAVEQSEWRAVKLHYEVVQELERKDASWGMLNRFRGAFTHPEKPWTEFEHYLEWQKTARHTEKIASHHPAYVGEFRV